MPSKIDAAIALAREAWPRLAAAAKRIAPYWKGVKARRSAGESISSRQARMARMFFITWGGLLLVATALALLLR